MKKEYLLRFSRGQSSGFSFSIMETNDGCACLTAKDLLSFMPFWDTVSITEVETNRVVFQS